MLKELINIIKDTALRHKAVMDFHYQSAIYTNAQNHHRSLQVIVDDVSYSDLLISYSPNIFQIRLDVYILGFVDSNKPILDIQSQAYDTAIQIIEKLGTIEAYQGILEVRDYSIITLSHYTDDSASGVKCSITMAVPFALCDLDDYFDDEPKEINENEDKEINLSGNTGTSSITLNPIKIPRNNSCGCK